MRVRSVFRELAPSLLYNGVTISGYAAWLRLRLLYRQRFGITAFPRAGNGIVQRLETVERVETASRSDCSVIDNPAYPLSAQPVVSVVVTLYNYARYVRACLESAAVSELSGLPGGIELVVVDDASTDEGLDVVTDFMAGCSLPVRLIRKATNTGLADARNIGLREARAAHVFILDADNLIYPQCLARLYQTIQSGDLAAAYGIIACFDDSTGEGVGLHSAFGWDVRQLVRGGYIDAMALFDRAKVLAVGGYSTELIRHGWFGWEDYDLWLKLAAAGHECRLCPQIVAAYRIHGKSMIRVTNVYFLNFVRYFNHKFASLVERVETHRPGLWLAAARQTVPSKAKQHRRP